MKSMADVILLFQAQRSSTCRKLSPPCSSTDPCVGALDTLPIPERFIDELKSRLNVSDVVGKRVRLERKGRELQACCPFHKEKTPSFTVNDAKGFYHCFGCGQHGNIISFMMEYEGLNFPEAVERLAAEAGMEVPVERPEERQKAGTLEDIERSGGPGSAIVSRAAIYAGWQESACLYRRAWADRCSDREIWTRGMHQTAAIG